MNQTMKTDSQIIKVTVDPDGDTKEIECVPAAFARQLEAECHRAQCERDHWIEQANLWRGRHSELFMKLNPITDASESQRKADAKADGKPDCQEVCRCLIELESDRGGDTCTLCGKLFKSKREAAESADEKPDGQAENAGVLAHADEKLSDQ